MLYTAALLSAAMLLAGCYSTDTDDDLLSTATLISIYPSTVSVGSAAATQNVVVTLAPKSKRNLDWSCSVQSAWVTAVREKVPGESTGTVYEDAVVLVFLENTAYKRQTTLTITASDGTVLEVPVVQKGIYADAYVKAAPESLTFMAENPQPAAVAIDTNMDTFAAVSDSDWCTVVDNGDGTITVTCTEYGDNTADRTAEITVTAGTPDTSEARTVIPVTQLRKDVYCYLYGSGVPKYPTREKWGQMTKLSDRVYVDSVYVKNGRFSVYTTEGDTYHLDGAGNLSAAETDLTVDVAGLRIVTLNLNEKTYSIERITTPNCLPDSEVAKYATSTYTANGRTKVWMRAGLDWNGGENIGGIKLGTGGLVRAYTSSAKLGLAAAGICDVCERSVLTYALDYTYLAKLQNLAAQDAGGKNNAADAGAHSSGDEPAGSGALFTIENLTYTDVVQAALSCVPERADEVKNLIANLTGGQGRLLGEELRVVRV